jgi:N-acetylneuraminate synthase
MTKFIAELCQNHNGSMSVLEDMINKCAEHGITFAKIQGLYSHELVFREEFEYQSENPFVQFRPFKLEKERLSKLDLTPKNEEKFVSICEKSGIKPMITTFTHEGVRRAEAAGFKNIKIASYDSTNFELISRVLPFAQELYISTGATTSAEIKALISFLALNSALEKTTLLHCKTEYPNELQNVGLGRIQEMRRHGLPVGFSDHSPAILDNGQTNPNRNLASLMAIHLGAAVIERHFTVLPTSETRDGKISASVEDFSELVRFKDLAASERLAQLRDFQFDLDILLSNTSNNFEPSVKEWWNRRYYQGRVRSLD